MGDRPVLVTLGSGQKGAQLLEKHGFKTEKRRKNEMAEFVSSMSKEEKVRIITESMALEALGKKEEALREWLHA